MYSDYTAVHWLFFFYFYCFFGWCFESAYVSIRCKRLVNRGFMRGPFLPLYGSGGIMMLVVSMPFQDNLLLVYVAGCIGATILEYTTGVAMEAIFKVRYWDYSNQRFNFQGHICLSSSLAWGFLTILMTEWMHKPVERFAMSIPVQILTVIVMILTAIIWADFALSFKAALDLKDVLMKLEKAREDLAHVQKRLDVVIALANEELAEKRQEITENIALYREEWSESIEEHRENIREELFELRLKYRRIVEERKRLSHLKDFFQRDMLRAHPSMSSVRFKEALEELKQRLTEHKEQD